MVFDHLLNSVEIKFFVFFLGHQLYFIFQILKVLHFIYKPSI